MFRLGRDEYEWVGTEEGVRALTATLRALAAAAAVAAAEDETGAAGSVGAGAGRVLVGIDTEWGDAADHGDRRRFVAFVTLHVFDYLTNVITVAYVLRLIMGGGDYGKLGYS